MSFWRYKLLEMGVSVAVGIVMIPLAFLLAALELQLLPPSAPVILIGVGIPYIVGSLVLVNLITAKLSKRWSS